MTQNHGTTDFIRPNGINSGVLLNTNNEALLNYKRAKKRLSSVPELEKKVARLEKIVEQLLEKQLNDSITDTD